ncbi:hypothetical protein HA72_0287 [Metallosphaera sedula]|uniref:Uncharacterized protein n=2 Tax=Metallosphaera sedula TaxID=43687 RepID=A4YDG2_METS5|nr:hypothetical protein Msed_0287 [Metallosphaera sedula DSM 5348]AIM26451.1 hypothetical protein HA72_0287 [Metallosphaera sedula]AKV73451.1 hypothetical protein MsedA_0298 [Metallosphaera sedula]AKV75694.1 hypothetical protein MsedB_0298 [Metallosphaera sedula]AKV77940.1 hypothetical protein MsedC_0297 [Metallosphaera sedula]
MEHIAHKVSQLNDKMIALITSVGIIFFILLSIPLNIFSGISLGNGITIEIAVSLYILLMSGIFIVVFKRFS